MRLEETECYFTMVCLPQKTVLKSTFLVTHLFYQKRKIFWDLRQEEQETVTQYACRIRRVAQDCEFKDAQEMLRDQFVLGIYDNQLAERLLAENASKLTFETALKRAEACERARQDRMAINTNADSVCRVETPKKSFNSLQCYRCGSKEHVANSKECRARNQQCRNCGKTGHYAKVCRSKKSASKEVQQVLEEPKYPASHTSFVIQGITSASKTPTVSAKINGQVVTCVVDTGAAVNVMPAHILKSVAWQPTTASLRAYGGTQLQTLGEAILGVQCNGRSVKAKFIRVRVSQDSLPLFCSHLCYELHLVENVSAINDFSDLRKFGVSNEIFEGVGKIEGIKYEIRAKENTHPKFIPPRRLPPALLEPVIDQINRWEEDKIVKKIHDPT